MHLNAITLRPEAYPDREHYPFCLPLFQQTRTLTFATPVTFFVGENGAGKSTLLRAIARRCGIHIWQPEDLLRVERNRWEGELYRYIDLSWQAGSVPGSYFGSDTFRHFSTVLEEWAVSDPGQLAYFGGRSLLTQSHGQALMSYFTARYRLKGLYLMDEPETALSPRTQLALLKLLGEMGAAGHAQFIIASHSPILMACRGARLYSFDEAPVREVRYEDTEHYQVYRAFMADPDAWR
jgi:predicted ATPase